MDANRLLREMSLAMGLLLSACQGGGGGGGGGDGNSQNGGNPGSSGKTASWVNKDMQTLVANRCANAGCHDGSVNPNYKGISEAAMKNDSNALPQVNSGQMPKGGAPLTASELATFRNFYIK